MSDWITLTPALVCEALSAAQSETIGARPNQGTALDPLDVAITDATARVRSAIRSNGLNSLSAEPQQIPPELRTSAITLTLLRLTEIWPLFQLGEAFKPTLADAENNLKSVADGTLPITLPAHPEPDSSVRRSTGASVERKRGNTLSARRLLGL